jgi:uncharacterized protein
MKFRKMGSLGWEVSALGFGCMRLPTVQTEDGEKINETEAIRIIRHGIDNGINYVDTAWPYHGGESELVVGKALLNGYREKVKLVSKLPTWELKESEDVDKFLTQQLDKLQTSYLDIYLVHGLSRERFELIKKLGILAKMEEEKKKGRIKYIGFSFHDGVEIFKEIIDFYPWDVCQIQHNYVDDHYQAGEEGLRYAASKGIAVIIMEPLKGGKLAQANDEMEKILEKAPEKHKMADWGLRYVFNKPEVSVVLSGMGSMDMVIENLETASTCDPGSLTKDELATVDKLKAVFQKAILVPCTSCGYCMPCPYGINIPTNFFCLNEIGLGADRNRVLMFYNRLATTDEQLQNSPNSGSSSMCTKCGECIPKCPQGIDIPGELEKVTEVLQ